MCALYPYYVWHDAVVQENATLAFLTAVAIWCLIHADQSRGWAAAAGAALGSCVLTKANLQLFAVAAPLWLGTVRGKRAEAAVAMGALALTVGPWLVRTELVVGSPVLYSDGGRALFKAHNRYTFEFFPERSIDFLPGPAFAELPPEAKLEFERLRKIDFHQVATSAWYWELGMEYIRQKPGLALWEGVRKILIGYSPLFSPRKGLPEQSVYFVSYFPILAGALAGVWLNRRRWRELGYFYVLFATFALGTAVFWAHTSHRVYTEPYLMMMAADAAVRIRNRRRDRRAHSGEPEATEETESSPRLVY